MAYAEASLKQSRAAGFGQTMRPDVWWTQPLVVFLGLGTFVVYSTWAAFQGTNYHSGSLLSPFYSPEIFGESPHRLLGPKPAWWPGWMPFSPALLILWVPGFFRLTCYYYRGAYYKAFWADPPACTVSEPRKVYRGEQTFPLIVQNLHRYFLYLGFVLLAFLAHDVWKAMWFVDPATGQKSFGIGIGTMILAVNVVLLSGYTCGCHSLRHLIGGFLDQPSRKPVGQKSFGIGIGTMILAVNVVLLSGYTCGCHSLRHLIGGFLDQPSRQPVCQKSYNCVSCLNRRHMLWAWMSLCSVMFSDVYVRLCAMGIWSDLRIL